MSCETKVKVDHLCDPAHMEASIVEKHSNEQFTNSPFQDHEINTSNCKIKLHSVDSSLTMFNSGRWTCSNSLTTIHFVNNCIIFHKNQLVPIDSYL